MQTRVRRTLLALAALALAVPVVDLILRMTAAAGSIQAETPSATPFIGMLLAASEFALAAVFAVFSLFVPGTRWARLWAVYHFLSGMSAAYHGSADSGATEMIQKFVTCDRIEPRGEGQRRIVGRAPGMNGD